MCWIRSITEINALVDEALNLAYHGARAQNQNFNITLERDFAAAIAPVELVPQDVMRVFLSLFGNGFYAANERREQAPDATFRPMLTVRTHDLDEAVEIAVRDNGGGIPPEHRDKLFQPFFTTKPTGKGTGLGLSISYDISSMASRSRSTARSAPSPSARCACRAPQRSPVDFVAARTLRFPNAMNVQRRQRWQLEERRVIVLLRELVAVQSACLRSNENNAARGLLLRRGGGGEMTDPTRQGAGPDRLSEASQTYPGPERRIGAMLDGAGRPDPSQTIADLRSQLDARQAELRDSEERHALIIRAVAEGIYEWDIERNLLWPSPRLIEIFGFHDSDLGAGDWNELVHPEDFPRYRAALRDCFKTVTPRLDCEYRVRHNDGAYRWIEDRAVPVRNAAGRAVRLVGAITDVTERKATEQALHDNEERYSLVSQAVAEGIYDWNVERNTLFVSPRLMEIFGFDGPGLSSEDWYGLVHAADREPYRSALRNCFKAQSPRVACEYRILVRSGEYRWVEDHALPIRDEAGRAIRLVGAVSDITDRKESERALREALEYQTATSDVLQVISRSTFDLQPVLDTVCETAARLCEAESALVFRRDGELYRMAASFAVQSEYDAWMRARAQAGLGLLPTRGTITGRTALEKRIVHIDDIVSDPEFTRTEAITLGRMRTGLGVPLLREGEPIGVIALTRQRVEPFTERQIELVRTFADQAVIAIENTRLLTELRESLEQQQAMAEVLQVINSSPGDLAPIFDAMLEKATRLCEAETGHLVRYEDGALSRTASYGVPAEFDNLFPQNAPMPDALFRNSVPARMIASRSVVHVPDLRDDESYRLGAPAEVAAVDQAGIRTALYLPLLKEREVVGAFIMHRMQVRPFSDKQIALLQNFAAQAVIAMENARLLGELRERTRDLEESLKYQTATSDVLQVISRSTFDLQPVLDMLVETAARLCEADISILFRREDEGYRYDANFGLSPGYREWMENARRDGRLLGRDRGSIVGRIALEGGAVHVHDAASDPEYEQGIIVRLEGLRTAFGVPLLREGDPIGVITLGRRRVEPFTERQIELVRTFADQAVIAIENTRLLSELNESLEHQRAIAELVQTINASPGNLQPVFDAMVEKAMRLCGAAHGMLRTFADGVLHLVAVHGEPHLVALMRQQGPIHPHPGQPFEPLLRGEQIVHMPDVQLDPVYRDFPAVRERVDAGGIRSWLAVALRKDEVLLGALAVYRQEVRPFSNREIALLQNFADQAVIAMDNARLLNEIRQRQAELRVTFDNMGDGVAMFDAELRLAAWNRNFQEILDLPDEFLTGRPSFAEYFAYLAGRGEYGSADLEDELRRAGEDPDKDMRFERTRPDGRVIEVRRNSVPGGGFVLIYGDITERKRAEELISAARDQAEKALAELKTAQASLLHAQKMAALGQLTAGIAHEIKNPLNFVNNFASLSVELLDELKETAAPGIATLDEEARVEIDDTIAMLTSNLEKISEHGRRADGIVKSMLAHSRGTSGERQSTDMNALVDEALNLAYHGARAQDQGFNVTLEREFDRALGPIELVPQDMTRVFLNLIGNGFYAAHKRKQQEGGAAFRPTLTVTTRDLGDAIEVRVRDNGSGIAPEYRDKLFQPFFTTKPTGEGTGLGLSISYDIVTQQHGGTIAADSEVGGFTEFTVRLPRRAASVSGERP